MKGFFCSEFMLRRKKGTNGIFSSQQEARAQKGGDRIEMKVDVVHHFPGKFEVIHRISQPAHFGWEVGRPKLKERRKRIMLELSCTNEEKIKVTVNPVTGAGNPVSVDGPIQVSVQSGDGSVDLLDGNSFYVKSGDNPGDTAFLVSGDADLGGGVETISDIVLLHVAGAKASNLGMTAGTPELK